MAERDMFICGTCSSQFSDLKIFIDHKQTCGTAITSIANNVDIPNMVTTPQQTSHIASQQVVLPSTGHASIVSLPVGMPHVILQTSSGLPQMYRIVLEPSLNTSTQTNPAGPVLQANQIYSTLPQSNSNIVETQYTLDTQDKNVISKEPSYIPNKPMEMSEKQSSIDNLHNMSLTEPSMTRLSTLAPMDQSWVTPQRAEARPGIFEPVVSSVPSQKGLMHPMTPAASLHSEEEDVATFLATQLVSQTTPQQQTKLRENASPKYCNVAQETSPQNHQDLMLLDMDPKTENFNLQEKVEMTPAQEEKYSNKQTPSKETPIENNDPLSEGFEVIGKGTKKFIVCSYENCKFFSVHKKDMTRHVRKHTGEKPFACPECGVRLSRQDKLKVHLRIHSKERPYACTEPGCSYRGNEKAHLRKHMRTHTGERPYRCQFCPYGARDTSHLTVHLRSHTGDAPFHCQMEGCSATFKTSSDLKRHEKLHTKEKPFKCTECDYASALKSNLKAHFRTNHFQGEKYACRLCPFLATSRRQFKEHEKAHSSGQSPHLGKPSPGKPQEGEEAPGRRVAPPKGRRGSRLACYKNFKCDKCGSGFVREDSFRSHVRQHDRIMPQGEQSPKPRTKTVFPLNFVLQGDGVGVARIGCAYPEKEGVVADKEVKPNVSVPADKTTHAPANAYITPVQTPAMGQEVPPSSDPPPDGAFSSYIFTIDGISTVYSSHGAHVKEACPGGHQSLPGVHGIPTSTDPTPASSTIKVTSVPLS